MLYKLLKYDLKSIYKNILLWNIFMIVMSFLAALNIDLSERTNMFGEIIFLITGFSIGGNVLFYFIIIFNRYYKSLYDSEGYFLHTLPVKPWEIVFSKLISATIMGIFTAISGFISLIIIYIFSMIKMNYDTTDLMNYILSYIMNYSGSLNGFILEYLSLFFEVVSIIIRVYFIISIVNIEFLEKHKFIYGSIMLFITEFINQILCFILFRDTLGYRTFLVEYDSSLFVHSIRVSVDTIILSIILLIIYYILTLFILRKKLYIK